MSKIKNDWLDQYGKMLSLNGNGCEWVKQIYVYACDLQTVYPIVALIYKYHNSEAVSQYPSNCNSRTIYYRNGFSD